MNESLIHCGRCNRDVTTHEYSQHLLDHVQAKQKGQEYGRADIEQHEFADSHCLATAHVDKGKKPWLRGQRKRAKAALLKAQKEKEAKKEAKKQEEERQRRETENRELARKAAKELSQEVARGRSLGTPYSALTISKGKTWKGRVRIIPGGSPGSKR